MKAWARILLFTLLPWTILGQHDLDAVEAHILSKEYAEAEKLLSKIVQTGKDPELKDKLGEVYGYQLKWDQAIEIYRDLTEYYPENAGYFFRYGGVMAKKAQSSSPFSAVMYVGRIKSSFKKALKLDPESIEVHWALIDLYISLPGIVGGSNSKAMEYALRLKKLSPLDGYLAIGYVHEYDDEPIKAQSNYMKALAMLDRDKSITRNQLNYQIGKVCSDYAIDPDKGISHLNTYISNYTVMDGVPLEWAYYRLAKIYKQKADKRNAMLWIAKALETKPDFEPALDEKMAIARL